MALFSLLVQFLARDEKNVCADECVFGDEGDEWTSVTVLTPFQVAARKEEAKNQADLVLQMKAEATGAKATDAEATEAEATGATALEVSCDDGFFL